MAVNALTADQFPPAYKARMIAAYPVIAEMSADEAYLATVDEREAAFDRILAARNLQRTHALFLADRAALAHPSTDPSP